MCSMTINFPSKPNLGKSRSLSSLDTVSKHVLPLAQGKESNWKVIGKPTLGSNSLAVLLMLCIITPIGCSPVGMVSEPRQWDLIPWLLLSLVVLSLIGWIHRKDLAENRWGANEGGPEEGPNNQEDENEPEADEGVSESTGSGGSRLASDDSEDNESVVSEEPMRTLFRTNLHINDPYFLSTADVFDILMKCAIQDGLERETRFSMWSAMLDSSTHWGRRTSESKVNDFELRETRRELGAGRPRSQSVAIEDSKPRYVGTTSRTTPR